MRRQQLNPNPKIISEYTDYEESKLSDETLAKDAPIRLDLGLESQQSNRNPSSLNERQLTQNQSRDDIMNMTIVKERNNSSPYKNPYLKHAFTTHDSFKQ